MTAQELLLELVEAIDADTTNFRLEASERAKGALADAREFAEEWKDTCGCDHRRRQHKWNEELGTLECTICNCQSFHHLEEAFHSA